MSKDFSDEDDWVPVPFKPKRKNPRLDHDHSDFSTDEDEVVAADTRHVSVKRTMEVNV